MPYDFTTAILRFRDLVTAQQQTIERHRTIIAQQGGVWWGWWNKAGERIPDDAFRQLLTAANGADGLAVFLMDSGTGRVYKALCRDLRWSNTGDRSNSPDAASTPLYYRDQEYYAWFRFTEIADEQPQTLTGQTYVRVDEFFESGVSHYDKFYNKRVYSVGELRQQDRTIWFVRPARPADASHEVALLTTRVFTPAHFPSSFQESRSPHLLWISDPHFSVDGHHGFAVGQDVARNPLARVIEAACRHHGIEQVAGVLVSGDLTWRADPAEFGLAYEFIQSLGTWTNLDNYAHATCPGNHDVRFSADPAALNAPVTLATAAAVAPYSEFYRRLFYIEPNQFLSSGRRFLLAGLLPVEVVLLNSSLLQQRPGLFQGHGFVGQDQLDDAARAFGWDRDGTERAVRVLVVHHHLLPVTYRDIPVHGQPYSVALDAEAITRWALRRKVDVVLHGHMHQPFYARLVRPERPGRDAKDRTLTIVGAGSAGVAANHLGEVARNTFAVLTFSRDALTVKMYAVHSTNPSEALWSITVPLARD